jgi:RimJ/RimL family protein N-acetyltransferase
MLEAIKEVTTFAFHECNANRVEIRCDEENSRSRNIPEKLGYTLVGTIRNNDAGLNGELRNTCLYSMIDLQELK